MSKIPIDTISAVAGGLGGLLFAMLISRAVRRMLNGRQAEKDIKSEPKELVAEECEEEEEEDEEEEAPKPAPGPGDVEVIDQAK